MVTKVKKNSKKISKTFPEESQNSASPYAATARALIALLNVQLGFSVGPVTQ